MIILVIILIIALLFVLLHFIRKRRKVDTTRLKNLIGLKVYTSDGMEIGRIEEIFIEGFKVHSFRIRLNKKKKFKVKGIIVRYKYVGAVRDIMIINKRVMEKIQNG